jgi:hypothetical protein
MTKKTDNKKVDTKKEESKKENEPKKELINFYELEDVKAFKRTYHNPNKHIHNIDVPFRILIIAYTGGGKTNALMNVLYQFQDTFNHILLVTRNKSEQLYEYLESKLEKDELEVQEGLDEFRKMNLDQIYKDKSRQCLIIFDDLVQEKDQQCIKELWLRGRKLGGSVSCVYLSQSYFQIPKFLRGNSNYVMLKKLNGVRDIKLILSDYSLGATKDQLTNMYQACMDYRKDEKDNGLLNHLLIDPGATKDKCFRFGWDMYLDPEDYNKPI